MTTQTALLASPQDGSADLTLGELLALLSERVDTADRTNVEAIIIDEMRRLDEGVLVRYGLRLSEFAAWQQTQQR